MLAVLYAVRTVMGFQFQTVGSTAPSLLPSLGIDNAQLGLLIGLYLLPGLPIALPGGMIGQKFGAKRVALAGLVLMVIGGVIIAMVPDYKAAIAGRLIAGTGGVLLNVMLAKLTADWFSGGNMTTAMAILVSSWALGIALGLMFDHGIAARFGWPAVQWLAAGLAVAALLSMLTIYRDPPHVAAAPTAGFSLGLTRYELGMAALAGAIWSAYNAGYIILVSFVPAFFATRGFSADAANWIASLLGWLAIAMVPVGGYLIDRVGRINLMMTIGFVATAAGIVAMLFSPVPVAWLIVIALACSLPSGAIMTLPVRELRPEVRAAGMGIYYMLYYAGMGVFPPLAGMARDRTGSTDAPLLCAATMFGLALVLLGGFMLGQRRRRTGEAQAAPG